MNQGTMLTSCDADVHSQIGLFLRCKKWHLKDSAYYCYIAYILRIARYSGFLSVMITNAVIFLRGLKLFGESKS